MNNKPAVHHLSFDGFGINGEDEHRTRIATINQNLSESDRQMYGRLFANSMRLKLSLQALLHACNHGNGLSAWQTIKDRAREVLDAIEGG